MNSYILIVIITAVFVVFSGLFGAFLYFRLRKKPIEWKAHIYESSKERLTTTLDHKGNVVTDYGDLYGLTKVDDDVVQRIETKDNKVHYYLKKAQREISQVNTNVILNKKTNEVIVVRKDDEYVLAIPAINPDNVILFETIPHDVKNLMRSELTIRSQQYKDQLTGWASVAPYVMGAVAFFSIVMLVFVVGKFSVDIYEARIEHDTMISDQGTKIAQIMENAVSIATKQVNNKIDPKPNINVPNASTEVKPQTIGVI